MNTAQAKQRFTIEDVMREIGAVEKRATPDRREIWFLSPWREEKTASFKVDTHRQTWFDHGGGEDDGGDMIKLVQRHLGKGGGLSSISEALAWFEGLKGGRPSQNIKQRTTASPSPKAEPSKRDDPKFILVKEKIVSHPAIVNYVINERRLPLGLVQQHCREIHFKAKDPAKDTPKDKKPLFGFGMKNDAGAWEVRAAVGNLKAVVEGEKTITTIYGSADNPKSLDVIEGNQDFLTKELLWPMQKTEAIIILNGAKLIRRAIEKIKTEPRLQDINLVRFWTQNDATGKKILDIFLDELHDRMTIGCMAENYRGFKDLNAWWTDSPEAKFIRPGQAPQPKQYYDTAWNMVNNSRAKPGYGQP